MSSLIKDLEEADDVIAFIDEIHQILNLGKAEGSLDAGNMLKPALARGLQIAGATTLDEFRGSIEKDKALLRRFQMLLVDEPSVEAAVTMLRGLKPKLEVHHGVSISDSALVSAAVMSNRYIADRHLPDKAIDSSTRPPQASASARSRRQRNSTRCGAPYDAPDRAVVARQGHGRPRAGAPRRDRVRARHAAVARGRDGRAWRGERDRAEEVRRTREELERRRWELDEAQRRGDYQRASELRYSVLPALEKKLPKEGEEDGAAEEGARVTSDDIARVVSKVRLCPWSLHSLLLMKASSLTVPRPRPRKRAQATGIPTTTLLRGDLSRLIDLESVLRARVKGQEPAISAVASAIRLSRAGLHTGNRPIASFLFLGSTGTGESRTRRAGLCVLRPAGTRYLFSLFRIAGKTELAKALSQELTGTERNLITCVVLAAFLSPALPSS